MFKHSDMAATEVVWHCPAAASRPSQMAQFLLAPPSPSLLRPAATRHQWLPWHSWRESTTHLNSGYPWQQRQAQVRESC